ncbi:tRNA (N6-threonylcarbamoyladenosine(37)-N6)-methyltransferase TrmO [Rubritalea tangerina]|uniref:tRNA (N6-threonylcarbamoyladenosine(37)-N6)-methyltransferase TrmO n=1 Tax=Rubritalea tangerina TaxID=430798 RepID=A0ABW4Z739_9BACT
MEVAAIGHIKTCYPEKFGVPRQPGLSAHAWGEVVLAPEYRDENFLRGIEGFSHLWLVFVFHLASEKVGRGTVRPPRLGGNTRRGVFATRAPYRPNRIGMSVVELLRVRKCEQGGSVLEVRGADLVSGTPILDIKPYISFCDSVPDARSGFVSGAPECLEVVWGCEEPDGEELKALVEETVALDPRPAYQEDSERVYVCCVDAYEVHWTVTEREACIKKLSKREAD